jgi:hypothetical protein
MMLCSSRAASSARLRCSWLKFIVQLLLLLLPAGSGGVLLLALFRLPLLLEAFRWRCC